MELSYKKVLISWRLLLQYRLQYRSLVKIEVMYQQGIEDYLSI